MRNHKSLKPEDLLRQGPGKIAQMVASEFYRASSGADYREDAIACFERARELMGVLETIVLPEAIAVDLKPLYLICRLKWITKVAQQDPSEIKQIATDFAQRFDLIGQRLMVQTT